VKFLLCNDDGIFAPGLRALERAFSELGQCWVVAPSRERSATGHALTLHRPLRARQVGERRYSVDGNPADCVYMGLQRYCPEPDLVICGINRGANVAYDVYYSGTVGAAREAAIWGLPALSVSLFVDWSTPIDEHCWASAGQLARELAGDLLRNPLPPEILLNLNVPDLPLSRIKGLRSARLGRRYWSRSVDERRDTKGRPYFWIGGEHVGFGDIAGSDGPAVVEGWATVTPLRLDTTEEPLLESISKWPSVRTPRFGRADEEER